MSSGEEIIHLRDVVFFNNSAPTFTYYLEEIGVRKIGDFESFKLVQIIEKCKEMS
jgi:hypothetical protein